MGLPWSVRAMVPISVWALKEQPDISPSWESGAVFNCNWMGPWPGIIRPNGCENTPRGRKKRKAFSLINHSFAKLQSKTVKLKSILIISSSLT
jgi:hypothetical protein